MGIMHVAIIYMILYIRDERDDELKMTHVSVHSLKSLWRVILRAIISIKHKIVVHFPPKCRFKIQIRLNCFCSSCIELMSA